MALTKLDCRIDNNKYNQMQLFMLLDSFDLTQVNIITSFLQLTTQEAFVNILDQDQTVQNMQSDLWSVLSTFPF